MKKRTIILCLAVLLCLVGVGVRIWYVNKNNEQLVTKTYPMGETVAFGDDFFYMGDDLREGYDIKVQSANIKTIQEFMEENGKTTDYLHELYPENAALPSHVYDVEVTVRNNNTEEDDKNIDLVNMQLTSLNKSYQVSMDLFSLLYPQVDNTSFGFKVRPGTETTVHLPYAVLDINWATLTTEEIKSEQVYLLLSMYPVKKVIEIFPE